MLIDNSLPLSPVPLILYGAGGVGLRAWADLEKLGLTGQILAWVDNDSGRWGQTLCGCRIEPVDYVADHPEAMVIICVAGTLIGELYETIRRVVPEDRVYVYLVHMSQAANLFAGEETPVYAEAPLVRPEISDWPAILSLYDHHDKYTADMVEFKLKSLDNAAWFFQLVGPVLNRLDFYVQWDDRYWFDPAVDLARYPALTICDLGAFIGDTLEDLGQRLGESISLIHAFEPDPGSFQKLKAAADKKFPPGLVRCHPYGCGERETLMAFLNRGDEGSRVVRPGTPGAIGMVIKRLDDLKPEVVGRLCLKMDVEGLELAALKGGAQIIKAHRPELAVSLYHKPGDLFEIPLYLKSLVPEYRFIIRNGPFITLYGTCDR